MVNQHSRSAQCLLCEFPKVAPQSFSKSLIKTIVSRIVFLSSVFLSYSVTFCLYSFSCKFIFKTSKHYIFFIAIRINSRRCLFPLTLSVWVSVWSCHSVTSYPLLLLLPENITITQKQDHIRSDKDLRNCTTVILLPPQSKISLVYSF